MKSIISILLFWLLSTIIIQAQSPACETLKQFYIQEIQPVSTTIEGHYNAAKKSMQNALMAIDVRDAKNYVYAAQQFVEKAEAEQPQHLNKKVIAYLKRAQSTLTLKEVQHYTKKAQELASLLSANN